MCFHGAIKHENDVSDMVGCLQVEKNYCSMKELKIYIRPSCIVFLFAKTENNNFRKEMKHVLRVFIAWWKPRQSLWEFSWRCKSSRTSWVFTDLPSNSPKRLPRISTGYECSENRFYFLNEKLYFKAENMKMIFILRFVFVSLAATKTLTTVSALIKSSVVSFPSRKSW